MWRIDSSSLVSALYGILGVTIVSYCCMGCWRVKGLEALWSEVHKSDDRKVLTPSAGFFRGQVLSFVDDWEDNKLGSSDEVSKSLTLGLPLICSDAQLCV